MSLKRARGAALFSKMFEKAKNRTHDLYSVPLAMLIHPVLQVAKKGDIGQAVFSLGVIITKVGMEDHVKEITDYCLENIDTAMLHCIKNASMDW